MILLCSILLILLRLLRFESDPLVGCQIATRLETTDLIDVCDFFLSPLPSPLLHLSDAPQSGTT